ncbi:MAG: thioredoxin fold domain-containing protein [Gammaproteobacteria bacterium]|nr:thioredoxin fold domain-containing protein [Gammaproteobacteria bacterium]MBT7307760.1 thioredoxin fold domain-containing protein [Gammaproteobacteria bacterium]
MNQFFKYFLWIEVLLLLFLGSAAAEINHLRLTDDLQRDGALAAERKVPLLLMVSAEECPYCMVMESDYLLPLLRNREYDSKVLIRKIHLDSFDEIKDFSGHPVEPSELSQNYGVWVTPTLLFLNGKGEEVQKRMVGLGVRDFVSAFIDESLALAAKMIR